MTQLEPVAYPFGSAAGLDVDPAYAKARDTPGMIRIRLPYGEPAWLAVRYDDVRLVLGDQRFSRAMAVEADVPRMGPVKLDAGIIVKDPPDHTRLRKLVAKAFTVRRVAQLRPRIRELAEELVDAMTARGAPVDLVEHFALSLPVAVICELIGVPVTDRPKFRAWSDAFLSTNRTTAEQFAANREEFREYTSGLIAARRAAPADDLMTALIEARDEHDRLSELELIDMCLGLLVAGHETTASHIPNFVVVLLAHPERLAELRADLDLVPAAVEELLRFTPLSYGPGFPRYATEDIEVGGVLVRAGEPVVVNFASANRDPRQFPDPGELHFDREENQHLGFGHGVHHCLGAPLARVELQEGLRALLAKLPGLHIAGDIVWKIEMPVRGAQRMPIGW
ncbi:cytochrome P450 [Amycolatopsis sp. CA-126428]|uniref:cytochrome P450 n=1 Tax=Amycolatopsis sp. CA-126428 TaxID=2073158 RepID=UPI0011B0A5E4|nr:cytochrome P450 [Amycolatopsis sp. CA-126428]